MTLPPGTLLIEANRLRPVCWVYLSPETVGREWHDVDIRRAFGITPQRGQAYVVEKFSVRLERRS